jgi:predicted nucleotidyltransferase
MDEQQGTLTSEIVQRLKSLRLDRVILFGSHSLGFQKWDSDIDLLVVLDTDEIPKTCDQKIQIKAKVRNQLLEFNRRVPIDLLVYSRPEYKKFLAQGSSFSRDIQLHGTLISKKEG